MPHDVRHSTARLANGLRVVTVELPHLHTATLVLYVKVGSRYESARDNGLSHFVEHMLFRGTDRYPSSYAINYAIEELGGTLYAETGRDYSMYQIALEPALVDQGLALIGEVIGRPRFTQIEMEREIILEEINEDFDEEGVEVCSDEIARRLMFGDHPLAFRITGPRENVERFDEADVRRHFERFYGAANAILCVAGPVEAAAVEAAAARHLGHLHEGRAAETVAPGFAQSGARYKFVRDAGSQTTVHLLMRALPELDADYVALQLLVRILDDGMSTRLHYRLCDQLGLAYSVSASLEPLHDVALIELVGASAHAKVPALLGHKLGLLDELRRLPVEPAELSKAKRRYRYDLAAAFDDANAMASWFGGTALYYPPPSFDDKLAKVDAVTLDDLQSVARRVLRPDHLVVVIVGGLSKARQAEVRSLISDWA